MDDSSIFREVLENWGVTRAQRSYAPGEPGESAQINVNKALMLWITSRSDWFSANRFVSVKAKAPQVSPGRPWLAVVSVAPSRL
jgi:hypothetical protein